MGRLYSAGFELNSNAAGFVEYGFNGSGITIVTTTVRTGTYAGQMITGGVNYGSFQFSVAGVNGPIFGRQYLNISSAPSAISTVFGVYDTSGTVIRARLRLNTSKQLELWDSAAKIGSSSATLNTGQWYRLELKYINSTNATLEGLLEGVSFASTTTSTNVGTAGNIVFGNISGTTITAFMDDIAVNDSSGSFQTGYPGDGKIIHLRPSAAGDNTTWTPLASTNFSQVSEVTPDGDTSYVSTKTAAQIDDYNITDSGIGASDTVNVVSVGVRFRGETGTPISVFKPRIKATSGGTTLEGTALQATTTSYTTNAPSGPFSYPLTTYQDPTSTNWTQATLDSAQIGLDLTTSNTNKVRVSTIWALVDYTPVAAPSGSITYIPYKPAWIS